MTKDESMFQRLFTNEAQSHSGDKLADVRRKISEAFERVRVALPAKPEVPVVEECSNSNTAEPESRYTEDHAAHFAQRSTRLATRALDAPTLLAPTPRHGSWAKVYDLGVIDAERATPGELFERALQAFKVPSK